MFRVLTTVYSILYTCSLLAYLPILLYRSIFGRKHRINLLQRVGRPAQMIRPETASQNTPSVWIHAVSVGEVNSVRVLVEKLALAPDQLWISTITDSGQALAAKLFQDRARVFYFPLDWKWASCRYLRALQPSVVLLVETEIWPGFITAAESLSVPVLLVNGRISDASFRRYRRIRFFLKPLLSRIQHFCMQSRQDKQRILELGAPPDSVHQVGNLKYDYELPKNTQKEPLVERVRGWLQSDDRDLLWICGSTRDGEEEILLETFSVLREEFPALRLLLAPRHPHRVARIGSLLESRQLSYVKGSDLASCPVPHSDGQSVPDPLEQRPEVVVLDTIGELPYLYQLADTVFVGGSLVPMGGHNLIEAAYFGKPILFGPHMENFREISDSFLNAYAALQVRSGTELTSRIRELLKDPVSRKWLGRNARKVIRDNQGALQRTVGFVRQYLEKREN